MQRSKRILTSVVVGGILALAALPVVSATTDGPAGGPVVAGTWEHRHATFHYDGITSLYTCAGLKSNIRALLQHLAARQDLTVRASHAPPRHHAPRPPPTPHTNFSSPP